MPTDRKRTCFVISPIGQDDTPTRRNADDLFDLVISPALERFDMDVIRADRIPRPSVITSDIVQLVQTADLCIIDPSDHNPNVFYECGRRHETGRPFVQLIRKGDALPFDVAGIRTIEYDLSTPRSTFDAVRAVHTFVAEMAKTQFEVVSSGESLSTIAAALDRIERKFDRLDRAHVPSPFAAERTDTPYEDPIERLAFQANPAGAFVAALEKGDLPVARAALLHMEREKVDSPTLLTAASLLTGIGDLTAAGILERVLGDSTSVDDLDALQGAVGNLVSLYQKYGTAEAKFAVIDPIIDALLTRSDLSDDVRASFLNQRQRMLYAIERFDDALRTLKEVLQLAPDTPSYYYNASLILEKLGKKKEMVDMIERCLQIDGADEDEDHLSQAVECYSAVGRSSDAIAAYNRLEALSPGAAYKLRRRNADVRRLFGG